MGRSGRARLGIGAGCMAVVVAAAAVIVTRGPETVAHAATHLAGVHNAFLVGADGVTRPARDGQLVPRGDIVRTAADGAAELVTTGRVVYLSGGTAVAVVDGGHQQLRTGSALTDARHGPGLRLDLAADTVTVPAGTAAVADRSVATRVGALVGEIVVTSSTGRALSVHPLYQAVLNGDALSTPTPLQLTDSAAEAHVVPTLVEDDLALNTLARGIDTTGQAAARIVEAAWTGSTVRLPAGSARSERVLPMLIADSTASAAGSRQHRYDRAVTFRAQGGSWGVVDHLLGGRASAAVAAYTALQHQRGSAGGLTGPGSAVSASGNASVGGVGTTGPGGPATGTGHSTNPGRGGHQPGTNHGHRPGGGGIGTPPLPPRATGALGLLVDTTGRTLAGVLSLLPLNAIIQALTQPAPPATPSHHAATASARPAGHGTTTTAAHPPAAAPPGSKRHVAAAPAKSHSATVKSHRRPPAHGRHQVRSHPAKPAPPPPARVPLLTALLGALLGH
ncbi:MAG TPA: hypothetical protein VG708_03370 [Mycobacteriales bacterium]|nr:hypothetical protein [Mycobacteriales bacterium]